MLAAVAGGGVPTTVRSVSVSGNTAVTTRDVLSWLLSRPGSPYQRATVRDDLQRIVRAYLDRGYLAAHAALADSQWTADSSGIDLAFRIDEGRPAVLGNVTFTGGAHLPAIPPAELELHPASAFDQDALERDLDAVLRAYENAGFPFARCAVDSFALRHGDGVDTLDVAIALDEGPRVSLDEIRVQGNKETKTSVIVRETRLTPGELFVPARIDAVRRRLLRLNIFSSVEEPAVCLRENRGGLLIKVQEGAFNTFDGVIGYVPSAVPGESGYLTGLASIAMRNLFGTGRKFSLRWAREDRHSEEFQVRYLEPWLFGEPINVGGGLFQRQQDSSYVHRVIDGRVELMVTEDFTAGLTLQSDRVIPSSDSTYASPVPASTAILVGGDLLLDTRSDPVSPQNGARYRIAFLYGRKHASASVVTGKGEGRSILQRLTLDCEMFLPTFPRQVAAIGLHGYDVRGGDVQESDMFRFGGAATLRGFRENQFIGAQVAWMNLEYRFLLARRSFLFPFVDLGYYARPANDVVNLPAASAFKYGYGLGIRVDTALGNMGVSFALGEGDSFSTAKIHVSLVNEF